MPLGVETERGLTPYVLRAADAAAFLSLSESSFRRLAEREGLQRIRIDGPRSAVLFRRVDIERLIDRMRDEQAVAEHDQ